MAQQIRNRLNILPHAQRDELLQRLLRVLKKYPERVQKLAKAIPYLLSPMAEILDLNPLSYNHLSYLFTDLCYLLEVLCKAVHLAPNLRQLFCKKGDIMLRDFNRDVSNYAYISLIINFQHLQILEMQYLSAELSDLLFLCGNLPSLMVLKIGSVENRIHPFPGEEILSNLNNLRLLCIEDMEVSHDAKLFIQNLLPKLDIIRDLEHAGLTFADFLNQEDERQRKTFTCDRHWFDNPADAEIHITHPNVVHLYVIADINATLNGVPPFPGIESIKISGILPNFYLQILERYGQNLRTLFIDCKRSLELETYEEFFRVCPQLEYLAVATFCGNISIGRIENVSQLKEIHLTGFCPWLNLLISAPKLKTVVLTKLECYTNDITRIVSLIAENRVLSQLEVLHIDLNSFGLQSTWFKNFTSMIKHALFHHPKLNLKLSCDGNEYLALARRMQEDEAFLERFFDLTAFYSDDDDDEIKEEDQEQQQGEEMEQEEELVQEELEQEQEQEQEQEHEQEEEEEDITDFFINMSLIDILANYQDRENF